MLFARPIERIGLNQRVERPLQGEERVGKRKGEGGNKRPIDGKCKGKLAVVVCLSQVMKTKNHEL
jgi:hypothetical protein